MADIAPTPQNIQDIRDAKKAEEAYNKASPAGKSIVPPPPPPPRAPQQTDKKAKGGSIRGHGVEQRGKTKGRFV